MSDVLFTLFHRMLNSVGDWKAPKGTYADDG
jgi:hypothetical protein